MDHRRETDHRMFVPLGGATVEERALLRAAEQAGAAEHVVLLRVAGAGHACEIRRLLVPHHQAAQIAPALPIIRALAAYLARPVLLLGVIDPELAEFPANGGRGLQAEVWRRVRPGLEIEVEAMLAGAATALGAAGARAGWTVSHGPVAACIREAMCAHDLVVLGGQDLCATPWWSVTGLCTDLTGLRAASRHPATARAGRMTAGKETAR